METWETKLKNFLSNLDWKEKQEEEQISIAEAIFSIENNLDFLEKKIYENIYYTKKSG